MMLLHHRLLHHRLFIEEPDTKPSGLWVPPSQGACARMLARWNEWVSAMDKPTMRKLPRSTHQLLAQTLDWLVKLIEDLDQPDVLRDTAELLVLCAPTLLWPVLERPDGAQKLSATQPCEIDQGPLPFSCQLANGREAPSFGKPSTPSPCRHGPTCRRRCYRIRSRCDICGLDGVERRQRRGRDCIRSVSPVAMPPRSPAYRRGGVPVPGPCQCPLLSPWSGTRRKRSSRMVLSKPCLPA